MELPVGPAWTPGTAFLCQLESGSTFFPAVAEHVQNQSLEGQLVEFADFLSVVSYILREGRMGNRALVREHAESLGDYANRFNHGRYDFLRPQVKVAQRMLFDAILGKECI